MPRVQIGVAVGDLLEFNADAVVLKHAQGFFAADSAVLERLQTVGVESTQLELAPGHTCFVESKGSLVSPLTLFIGTVPLSRLGYHEIRLFAGRMLKALETKPHVKHVACTVHGVSIGLDEDEAVLALVGGLIEAFQRGVGPTALERVTIIEKRDGRAKRMRLALLQGLEGTAGLEQVDGWSFSVERQAGFLAMPAMASAGLGSTSKPHAFVAMPFVAEFEDVFHYGIQGPVKRAGLLCERVDQAIFDGLIIQRIRERIDSAKVVVAELSGANPNVYLEVGYAWGRGRPTVLLVRDVNELRFDLKAHRCIVYKSIRELEQLLERELATVL